MESGSSTSPKLRIEGWEKVCNMNMDPFAILQQMSSLWHQRICSISGVGGVSCCAGSIAYHANIG